MNTEQKINYYSAVKDDGATRRRLMISRLKNRHSVLACADWWNGSAIGS